jgi:hypothetical protein
MDTFKKVQARICFPSPARPRERKTQKDCTVTIRQGAEAALSDLAEGHIGNKYSDFLPLCFLIVRKFTTCKW